MAKIIDETEGRFGIHGITNKIQRSIPKKKKDRKRVRINDKVETIHTFSSLEYDRGSKNQIRSLEEWEAARELNEYKENEMKVSRWSLKNMLWMESPPYSEVFACIYSERKLRMAQLSKMHDVKEVLLYVDEIEAAFKEIGLERPSQMHRRKNADAHLVNLARSHRYCRVSKLKID